MSEVHLAKLGTDVERLGRKNSLLLNSSERWKVFSNSDRSGPGYVLKELMGIPNRNSGVRKINVGSKGNHPIGRTDLPLFE